MLQTVVRAMVGTPAPATPAAAAAALAARVLPGIVHRCSDAHQHHQPQLRTLHHFNNPLKQKVNSNVMYNDDDAGDHLLLPPTALLFTGQGAQQVGMTAALLHPNQASSPSAAAAAAAVVVERMYEEAAETLGYNLKAIVMEGPTAVLEQTVHAQPALLIAGLAAVEVLRRGGDTNDSTNGSSTSTSTSTSSTSGSASVLGRCEAVAGLSLGEYCALVHAGSLSFADALKVVHVRATAMQQAGECADGTMLTVIGLDDHLLQEYCTAAAAAAPEGSATVRISNYLFPRGRVIAGNAAAVAVVRATIKDKHGRRVITKPLASARKPPK